MKKVAKDAPPVDGQNALKKYSTMSKKELVLIWNPKVSFIIEKNKKEIQTHLGKIIYNNEDKGNYIISSKGEKFWILEPSAVDLSLKIKRKTTIIYPKEAGLMILETGIGAGSIVAEIGTGSGSLTFMLAKIVGKNGKVFTFEKRKDFLQLAMENLKKYGLNEHVVFFNIDVEKENILNHTKQKVDAVFVDVPEPWKIIDKIYEVLKDGHTTAFLNPTIEQILKTKKELENKGFIRFRCYEILQREMLIREGKTRPKERMISHTGYIYFANKVKK